LQLAKAGKLSRPEVFEIEQLADLLPRAGGNYLPPPPFTGAGRQGRQVIGLCLGLIENILGGENGSLSH
jgi:hypothetical protein